VLPCAESRDGVGLAFEEGEIAAEIEYFLIDPDRGMALAKILAQTGEFILAHRIEPHLIEEAQQPWLAGCKHWIFKELVQIGRVRPTS